MPKKTKNIAPKISSLSIFLGLGLALLLGAGIYLAIKNYSEPKFKIQPIDSLDKPKITQAPQILDPEYLDKLIAKEWFWVETTVDSSVGIKPYNLSAFRIKFNSDLTFQSSSDCNTIGGNYEVFENKIRFKEIVRSEKYCMKSREQDYVDGLSSANEISFNDKNEMILKYKDSNSFMKFR